MFSGKNIEEFIALLSGVKPFAGNSNLLTTGQSYMATQYTLIFTLHIVTFTP